MKNKDLRNLATAIAEAEKVKDYNKIAEITQYLTIEDMIKIDDFIQKNNLMD